MSNLISWPKFNGDNIFCKNFPAICFVRPRRYLSRYYIYRAHLRNNPKPGKPKWEPVTFDPFEK